MSQFVSRNAAKTLEFYCPNVPDSAGTWDLFGGSGDTISTANATGYTALSTALTVAAVPGVRTLTVTSTTGFIAGRQYLLGGVAESLGGEFVTVSVVTSATVLALVRPVRFARAIADTIKSTRVTFAVPAITTCARNLHIAYTYANGGVTLDPVYIPFDVTRYTPQSNANVESLRSIDALVGKRIAEGTWLPDVLARGWTMILQRIAAKVPPGGVVGTIELTNAHSYLTVALLLESGAGDENTKATMTLYRERFTEEFDSVLGALKIDENMDGVIDSGESAGWSPRTMDLIRC